jgi:hypothetical protein
MKRVAVELKSTETMTIYVEEFGARDLALARDLGWEPEAINGHAFMGSCVCCGKPLSDDDDFEVGGEDGDELWCNECAAKAKDDSPAPAERKAEG